MTTENIKMAMEMISQLGADGKEAFIWYLMCTEVLPTVLGCAVGLVVACLAYRIAGGLFTTNKCYGFFTRIRDENGIGCPGPLSDGEIAEVERFLNRKVSGSIQKGTPE